SWQFSERCRVAGIQPRQNLRFGAGQLGQQVAGAVQAAHGGKAAIEEIIQVAEPGRMDRAPQHAEGGLQHAAAYITVDMVADFANQIELTLALCLTTESPEAVNIQGVIDRPIEAVVEDVGQRLV